MKPISAPTEFSRRDPEASELVARLPKLKGNVVAYREQMRKIGKHLGSAITPSLTSKASQDICVVCTVEDADFLARGLIDALADAGLSSHVRLTCLWNEKIRVQSISASPIVKEYSENYDNNGTIFIIVKSIISGACVVKTNLTRALSEAKPAEVFVAAPVMLVGAEEKLKREFPTSISEKFKFVHFATHFKKDADENVIPGIGGSVYELLGLGDNTGKISYMPELVKERRRVFYQAHA